MSSPPKSWQTYARELHREESTRHKAHQRRRRTTKILMAILFGTLVAVFFIVLLRSI